MASIRKMMVTASLAGAVSGFFWAGIPDKAFGEPHETRIVGRYKFVVGFKKEPTFISESNAANIFVRRASDDRPIDRNAGDIVDLEVEVQLRDREAFDSNIIDSAQLKDPLTQAFRSHDEYNSWFKPTVEGPYAFHITGVVSDETEPQAGRQEVDETFVCGMGTLSPDGHGFHCVEIPQAFPGRRHRR